MTENPLPKRGWVFKFWGKDGTTVRVVIDMLRYPNVTDWGYPRAESMALAGILQDKGPGWVERWTHWEID